MKVSLDLRNEKIRNNAISFEGYRFVKSDQGFKEFEVAYPYDENKDNCYLEVYRVEQDQFGNYYTTGRAYSKSQGEKYYMNPGSNRIDLAEEFGIADNQAFAYHFLLEDKHGKDFPRVRIDAGDIIDERSRENENRNIFNIVASHKSNLSRGGAMKLVIIDSQKVGYVYNDRNIIVEDKALKRRGQEGIKTLTNKFGGTLAGLEKAVEDGEYDNYGRIISLPIFTDDDFSAHAYWNKNCMQMASSLGNINNYASLQRKMFGHGLNFVSDGAFVNEGLQGVHFKHMLRWGEESPYFNWFRASSIKDGPLSMGVFAKNKDYISHKVVNSPYIYKQNGIGNISITKDNPLYDPKKPTYIQFFDIRLVTDKERNDTAHLIKTYSKMSTPNVYDLHTHNDSVFPYAFEINPETYNKNIKNLNKYNSSNPLEIIDLDGPMAARVLSKFENFVVDGKFESGFETWDANPDIAKLSFVYSNTDAMSLKNLPADQRRKEMERILRGNIQVQDYAVTSGQYWTQKTDDILRLHVAQTLNNIDTSNPKKVYKQIMSLADNKTFPLSVKSEVTYKEVANILSGMYNHRRVLSDEDKKSQILEGLMNTPLDSFEFGDNLVSVLASPLLTKRASKKSEIGVSRYDLYKAGNPNLSKDFEKTYTQMEKIYEKEMYSFADSVLGKVNSVLPENKKLFNGSEVTEFGKYVLPLVTPEIAKYAVVKSLAPNIELAIDKNTGEISYDYKSLKEVSLQTLGITNPSSPEDEAEMVLKILRKGLKNLDSSESSEMVESVLKTIKDTNVANFQLADLIIDKTQSGLDWRIDATKDIADVEALRNRHNSFDYTWRGVTDFWKRFTQGVISKNPNAYTVAEITDANNLHENGYGGFAGPYRSAGKYPHPRDIVPKFLRDTGMTAKANYSFFFNDISQMFTRNFETGNYFGDPKYLERLIHKKMVGGDGDAPFIRQGSLESLMYSYTFIGNHDKPRALHCAAMDMGLFYTDLNNPENKEYRTKAYQVVNDKFLEPISEHEVNNYDFSRVSPKAIAMADAIRPAFINILNQYKDKYHYSQDVFNRAFIPISKAISDLAQGKYLGKRFDPEAFGIKPIDVAVSMVLKQAREVYGFYLPSLEADTYENEVFEAVMTPAMTKLLGIMKYLVALPGMPTMFDGDDVGATGYDTKTKNMYLQGRQRIHDEWITEGSGKYKSFIAKYKKYFDDVMSVRRNPKCNALNNGAVYTLPQNTAQDNIGISSILRQAPDGRMAISIFNPTGLYHDPKEGHRQNYIQNNIELNKLYLNENFDKNEGVPGLRVGLQFRNAQKDDDLYEVRCDNDGHYYVTGVYNGQEVPIKLHDTTLILYHEPDAISMTHTGAHALVPNSQYIANAYQTNNVECGKKLALLK